jgi:hypothetical protein
MRAGNWAGSRARSRAGCGCHMSARNWAGSRADSR